MSDAKQDFLAHMRQAIRPLYVAVPIVAIALIITFVNLSGYDNAVKQAKASIAASTPTTDETQPSPDATASIDKLTKALDAQRTGRLVSEAITVIAILYLIYALWCVRGVVPAVQRAVDEALVGRDGQIESLRKNRALLMTTLDAIGDALVSTDASGRITFMNPIAEKLTGWQEADAVGKEFSRVVLGVSEKTGEKIELPVAQVLKNNIEREIPASIVVADRIGATKPIAGHAVPIWDESSKVVGVAVVFRDITEKRGAREAIKTSEAHKEAIIENALDCVVMTDSAGKVIEFNAAAEATFGYQRAEALGRQIEDLIIPKSLRESHTRGMARFLETRQPTIIGKRVELKGLRKDGVEIPIELAITQVPRQEPPVFATFLRDISERKAAEAALVAAKDAALAESRDKSQFLNNMSDELRTPLNAVIGYSEMLQEEINERRPAEFIPDLKKINEAGRHLLMLVTDVLDLSRIEAGKMDVFADPFDVQDLIDDVAAAAVPFAARNKNNFKVSCGANLGSMVSDRLKIRQSILYLVNNASKFAHERDLELQVARNGSTLQFRMVDLSPGIADATTEQLADAFATANASSTIRFGGHGLGLVIARHLCDMLGGSMKGERQPGHSPVYTIELPDKAPSKK